MWKSDSYQERVYGATAATINGAEAIVIQGRENQYILDYTDKWKPILESQANSLQVNITKLIRYDDRISFKFNYLLPGRKGYMELDGLAQVVPLGTIPIVKDVREQGIIANIKVADSATETGAKIIATPITASVDLVTGTVVVVTAPIWINFVFMGW